MEENLIRNLLNGVEDANLKINERENGAGMINHSVFATSSYNDNKRIRLDNDNSNYNYSSSTLTGEQNEIRKKPLRRQRNRKAAIASRERIN